MRPSFFCHLVLFALVSTTVANAESKLGTKAAPKSAALTSKTAYKVDPLRAIRSKFLQSQSAAPITSETELELLEDANDGHVDNYSMAKAVLIICGIEDPAEQKQYFAQLKAIETECKRATAGIRSTKTRAEILGKTLLKGPMHAGYVSGQSDFIKTLHDGTFNCVSSAVMYNLMAPRVGIQVRTVTISGHVYSRTLDFDIEPTSGEVYPLDDRASRALKMQTVVKSNFAPYKDQLFRETGNAGLLAEIYNNDACAFDNQKQYALAVGTYLKSACLDPGNPNVVYNLRVVFGHWVTACNEKHDAKRAAAVQKFAEAVLRPYEETALKVAAK